MKRLSSVLPRTSSPNKRQWMEHFLLIHIFILGVLLRVHHTIFMPFGAYGHDVSDHTRYILYMASNWKIPVAFTDWEMHQPPLYYVLGALVMRADLLLGRDGMVSRDVQLLSLSFSIVALWLSFWIGRMLFSQAKHTVALMLFCAVAATLPALIFLTSTINNDTLSHLWTLLGIGMLLRWWETGKDRDWILASLVAAVSVLIKINASLVLPMLVICLVLRKGITWRRKALLGGMLLALCGAIAGPYVVQRFHEHVFEKITIPSSGRGFEIRLLLGNDLSFFTTFRLTHSIVSPFINVWMAGSGREFFWEYLFKTSLFGEWQFPQLKWLASAMVASGLGVLGLSAWGFWQEYRIGRSRWTVPLATILLISVGAMLTLRLMHHCVCLQDFRLIPAIVVPVTAWSAASVHYLEGWRKRCAICCIGLFAILCAAFISILPHL